MEEQEGKSLEANPAFTALLGGQKSSVVTLVNTEKIAASLLLVFFFTIQRKISVGLFANMMIEMPWQKSFTTQDGEVLLPFKPFNDAPFLD